MALHGINFHRPIADYNMVVIRFTALCGFWSIRSLEMEWQLHGANFHRPMQNMDYGGFRFKPLCGFWNIRSLEMEWHCMEPTFTGQSRQRCDFRQMAVSGSTLYGDFGTSGLWKWNGAAWSQLTSVNPENMVVSGSTLYADFGTSGLWKWNGSSLVSTHRVRPRANGDIKLDE